MDQTSEEFFHDFRQEMLAGAEANSTYQLEVFMDVTSNELIETGFVEGFEHCHYRTPRGMRVDGYWLSDEGELALFIADFEFRRELSSLTKSDVDAIFKRLVNFAEASLAGDLEPDITTPEYDLVQQICSRRDSIRKIEFYILSERALSDRFQGIAVGQVQQIPASYHVWDISRFQRQRSSRGQKEALNINFAEAFGASINCLAATSNPDEYQSYLIVMPATILASLYEKYSARLLEQNVRTFLQARAQVNKGIRATILNEPHMFFAYNNGITATAQHVETVMTPRGLELVSVTDLQIVNGGQTTASLFHTHRRDKADLSKVFVQMKLSVIESAQSEIVVPLISEYANTQNRVNAADFFSNHPFHVRMAEFSRRIWAPAQRGEPRETKWFYERARGQYLDSQSKLSASEQRRFKAEFPKLQMFTKTDLAKFENCFDDHPKWVHLGSQKNFARYASRIGKDWEKSSDSFNEMYFRRSIARGILFRTTEKLVTTLPWYSGGYRANVVAYTLSMLGEIAARQKSAINHNRIWSTQEVDEVTIRVISTIAEVVNDCITSPPQGVSNISEWCKKEACWTNLLDQVDSLASILSDDLKAIFSSAEEVTDEARSARKVQKVDNGIEAQKKVFSISPNSWYLIAKEGSHRSLFSEKEIGVLRVAEKIPQKIPTEKQSILLLDILEKARKEGII